MCPLHTHRLPTTSGGARKGSRGCSSHLSCRCQPACPLRLSGSSVQLFGVAHPCGLENDPGVTDQGAAVATDRPNTAQGVAWGHAMEELSSRWTKLLKPSLRRLRFALCGGHHCLPALAPPRFRTRVSSVRTACPVPALNLHTHKKPHHHHVSVVYL